MACLECKLNETAQTRLFESLLSRKLRCEKKNAKGRCGPGRCASQLQIGYSVQLKSNPCYLTGIMILSDRWLWLLFRCEAGSKAARLFEEAHLYQSQITYFTIFKRPFGSGRVLTGCVPAVARLKLDNSNLFHVI